MGLEYLWAAHELLHEDEPMNQEEQGGVHDEDETMDQEEQGGVHELQDETEDGPSGQEDNEFAEETISLSEVQSTERVSKRPRKRTRLEDFVDIEAEQSDDEDDEDEDEDEGMGGLEDN
ncbi:hypothetical protein H0H92_013239, partial [Tricholoma furcatifolium]